MKHYIISNPDNKESDFEIIKVLSDDTAQFEVENKGKILAIGDSIQEAILSFSQKDHPLEPVDLAPREAAEETIYSERKIKR